MSAIINIMLQVKPKYINVQIIPYVPFLQSDHNFLSLISCPYMLIKLDGIFDSDP